MSCNGCRVLRKGCSENCLLRPCLEWIDGAEAQAHATVFVAKFFGRAGLMSFISAVPLHQRPALFQSLLYEACGRSVNPVNGAVALLAAGNWHLCQAAVQTVLSGGNLQPIPELLSRGTFTPAGLCDYSEAEDTLKLHQDQSTWSRSRHQLANLELSLTPCSRFKESSIDNLRPGTPPLNSDASVTTTCTESLSGRNSLQGASGCEVKLLNLFS